MTVIVGDCKRRIKKIYRVNHYYRR